jgi:hypothetical protein
LRCRIGAACGIRSGSAYARCSGNRVHRSRTRFIFPAGCAASRLFCASDITPAARALVFAERRP